MDLLKGFVFDLQKHSTGIDWASGSEQFVEITSDSTGVNLTTDTFELDMPSTSVEGNTTAN